MNKEDIEYCQYIGRMVARDRIRRQRINKIKLVLFGGLCVFIILSSLFVIAGRIVIKDNGLAYLGYPCIDGMGIFTVTRNFTDQNKACDFILSILAGHTIE